MTPSIDISLPPAAVAVRQTSSAAASAPVSFQECLDGVPPSDETPTPVVKGRPGDDQSDAPHTATKPVEDAATLAALAALSLPAPVAVADAAPPVARVNSSGPTTVDATVVAIGLVPPRSGAVTDLVGMTLSDPGLTASVAAVAGQVASEPVDAGVDAAVDAAGSSGEPGESASQPSATGAAEDPTAVLPSVSSTVASPAVVGSAGAAPLAEPGAPTQSTPQIDAASMATGSQPVVPPASETTGVEFDGAKSSEQMPAASRPLARAAAAPGSTGDTAAAAMPASRPGAPSAGGPSAVASRRSPGEAANADASPSSASTVLSHGPVRTADSTTSTISDAAGRNAGPMASTETDSRGATPTHTGPMRLDVDLSGEGLGALRLRATSAAGQLHVSLTATEAHVRSALLDHSQDLRREMRSAGLDLASLDVNGSPSGRAGDGDPNGRPAAALFDDGSPARRPATEPTRIAGAPLGRDLAPASPSRLDLLL